MNAFAGRQDFSAEVANLFLSFVRTGVTVPLVVENVPVHTEERRAADRGWAWRFCAQARECVSMCEHVHVRARARACVCVLSGGSIACPDAEDTTQGEDGGCANASEGRPSSRSLRETHFESSALHTPMLPEGGDCSIVISGSMSRG